MTKKLSAGYGETVITPPLGLELCGYGFYLNRRAESVLDDIKARAVYLKHDSGDLILVSCDILGFTIERSDEIRRKISDTFRVPLKNILLACTHTHTAPTVQYLPGLGEPDPAYQASLPDAVCKAVEQAANYLRDAGFSYAAQAVEPIGYNRRLGNFVDVDPFLKSGVFKRDGGSIYLLNYACHAVTLGRSTQVSADWPGALARRLEKDGHRALVFQGFCGDLDPVVFMNHWGGGTGEDLRLYGDLLADRLAKSEKGAKQPANIRLAAAEQRFRIPLSVCRKDEIDAEAAFFLEKNKAFPLADRFAEEWRQTAHERHREFWSKPYLDDVPVQALAVGDWKLVALPGEVFCRFGLNLGKEFPGLMTAGYANGNIGYLPHASAFEDTGDYACYCAPRFYTVFPFTADLERIFMKESRGVLKAVAIG